MGYIMADAQLGTVPKCVRTMAFVEGAHSETRVASPDPIEDKGMKVGSPDTPPGVKVANPEKEIGPKVANLPGFSVTGDFSRTIKVSGEDDESRQKVGLKLYATSMDPTFKVRPRGR
jgi:hypothetical protein